MRNSYRVFCLSVLLLVGPWVARTTADDVPPRSEGWQTLEVPKQHLDLGEVYYVTPGEDTQLVCVSDATLQRVAVTCNRIVGYLVTPFDVAADKPVLIAGAFRLPVMALQTGMPQMNDVLRGPGLLNASQYPEITFRVLRSTDAELVSEDKGRRQFKLTVTGELVCRDKAIPLELPVRLDLIPFTWGTMARSVGELLTLRTHCDIKLVDLGLERPDRSYAERLADVLNVDVFLLCNTMSPEKNLDPQIKTAVFTKQLRLLTLLRDFGDTEKGYELGRGLLQEMWDDAQGLNRLAAAILEEEIGTRRDFKFILKAARRANELTKFKDPTLLSTLARAYFQSGDLAAAVEQLRKATVQLEGLPASKAAELRAALEQYEKQLRAEPGL